METKKPIVKFVKVHENARIPQYATSGASGMDLHICEDVELRPRERKLVTTGLKIKLPKGYEGQVRSRSGLAAKQGIKVLNSPGTIDMDYEYGELKVILYNSDNFVTAKFIVGDRIAQLVIVPVIQVDCLEETEQDIVVESERGGKGIGSTGIN